MTVSGTSVFSRMSQYMYLTTFVIKNCKYDKCQLFPSAPHAKQIQFLKGVEPKVDLLYL